MKFSPERDCDAEKMLYSAPSLDNAENAVIASIYLLSGKLDSDHKETECWTGLLSRQVFERAAGDAVLLSANIGITSPLLADTGPDDWRALEGYRRALSDAMRPEFSWSLESVLALHSILMEYDRRALPGELRAGKVKVLNVYGEVVYEPPDADRVPLLMLELVDCLDRSDDVPAIIRAAIAHLNILRIHPFQDGNGRMGRCLQASILSRGRALPTEIANLEEYVGQHTRAYNDALESTGTRWKPVQETRAWIRFCLTGRYRQAIGLIRRLLTLSCLSDELNAQRRGSLSEKTIIELGGIFGARPDAIRRWWRMRPDRVIEKLMAETRGHKLRDWPWGEPCDLESYSRGVAALLKPASMDPTAPLPDPFKVLDDTGYTNRFAERR